MFNVHKTILSAVCGCASPEPSRYALMGVRLEEEKGGTSRAIATDGKIMAVVECAAPVKPEDRPLYQGAADAPNGAPAALVPARDLAAALKSCAAPKRSSVPCLAFPAVVLGENETSVFGTDLEKHSAARLRNLEGSFPAWKEVLPKGKPKATVSLDADRLEQLLAVARAMNPKMPVVRLDVFGEKDAVRVSAQVKGAGVEFSGLIMPVYTGE